MAQERLTDRTALNETPNDSDLIHVVDVSDTTDNPNGTSKKLTVANLLGGITAVGTQPVENEYADITALLADQGNQTETFFQYVIDASADPNVASGDAYYEKLSGSTGTLATDYRLLSDTETQIITDSNGYRVFRIQYIQDDSSPNDTATGGRIGFNYDTGTDKVTSVVFNNIYSNALDIFYAQRADNNYLIRFYNRQTGVYSFAEVTGWTVSGNYYIVDVTNTIDVSEISVNNRIELFFDIDNGGSSQPTSDTGTTITFTEDTLWNEATPLTSGNLTLDLTGAVKGSYSVVYCDGYTPTISGEDYYITSGSFSNSALNVLSFWYDGTQIFLNIGNVITISAPSLTLLAADAEIDVSWSSSLYADNYVVQRSTDNFATAGTQIYSGALLTYTDTGLTNGTTYYYRVMASGTGYRDSDWSATANATPTASEVTLIANWDAADDGSVTTAGGAVTSWVDAVNSYNLTESTNTPTHSTTNDEIAFSSDRLNASISAFNFQQSDNFSILIKGLRLLGGGTILENKIFGANPGWTINCPGDGSILYFSHRTAGTQNYRALTGTGGQWDDNTARDFIFINQGGTVYIYDETNTSVGTNVPGTLGTVDYTGAQTYVGNGSTSASSMTGYIKQIKVWTGALNETERATELGL